VSAATKRGSYPHPVVDASDDVNSIIEVFNVTVAPAVDDVEIRFQVRMDDPDIQELMNAGVARLSFRWKCGSTLASEELEPDRATTHIDSVSFVAWIPQERIRRSVRVEIKVVALKPVSGYRLRGQHRDYGDSSFDVARGDVLADGGTIVFEADKLYDPLNPPIGSCFQFIADETLRRGIRVRWGDDEFVTVRFPAAALSGLGALAARPDLQISLVVLPALMETIIFIKENADPANGEDLSHKLWYQAIAKLVEAHGSLEDRAFDLAQKILNNPLDLALEIPLSVEEDDE